MDQYLAIKLDPEIERLIIENGIDLLGELQKEAAMEAAPADPDLPIKSDGSRDVALIILTSAFAVPIIASGIARIISALSNGHHEVVTVVTKRVALDGNGKPIRDANGNPVFETSRQPQVVRGTDGLQQENWVKGKYGELEISIGDRTGAPPADQDQKDGA